MSQFSPTDAALEGFRLAKENPLAILAWSLLQLAVSLVMIMALIQSAGPEINLIIQVFASSTPDPIALNDMLKKVSLELLPVLLIVLPISLLTGAIVQTAIIRAIINPQEKAFGFLRFGANEFRVLAVSVLISLIFLAFYSLSVVVLVVLTMITSAIPFLAGFLSFLTMLLIIAMLVYLGIRFSLAPAQTYHEKRINLFGSWALTRHNFWRVLGAFFLAFIFMLVVMLVGGVLSGALGGLITLGAGGEKPDFSTINAYFTPGQMVSTLIESVLGAMAAAILTAPGPVIYRLLAAKPA